MVNLFLLLSLAMADVSSLHCSPYSTSNGKTFSAKGDIDFSTGEAKLMISLNGEDEFEESFKLVAVHNRYLYKMYFLEDQGGLVPSIVLRISQSQLAPMSNLYLQTSETMTAACSLSGQ
ncbi:MAG: hypothetical protein KDD37_05670 [Bdellovibrionales bacterium]|nr:hypothetical protein [Bdellovibrionales bacterium]